MEDKRTAEETVSDVAKFITASFYLLGLGFMGSAIFKFRAHKDNPTQIPVGTPVALSFTAFWYWLLDEGKRDELASLGVTYESLTSAVESLDDSIREYIDNKTQDEEIVDWITSMIKMSGDVGNAKSLRVPILEVKTAP